MTPFDLESFTEELRSHFMRCGQPMQQEQASMYFAELKVFPLVAVLKAIRSFEDSDRKDNFAAKVIDLRRTILRLARDGEVTGAHPKTGKIQCAHIDGKGSRCGFVAVAWIDGQPGMCSAHFLPRKAGKAEKPYPAVIPGYQVAKTLGKFIPPVYEREPGED